MKNGIFEIGNKIFLNLNSGFLEFLTSKPQDQKYQRYLTSKNLKLGVLLICLFAYLLIFALAAPSLPAYASSFSTSYLRLDSQMPNSALSGTVCAQPSSAGAGTENKVIVTFPNDFTISSSTSDWTTSTTNLPSNSTAWPSIGTTATGVSGQSVTFSSSDLTADTLYCFNFTGSSSITGATGVDKTGIIASKNASSSTIDSTTYAVSVISNNQISVTASIDPKVSDLPVAIESTTAGTQFPQSSTISYQITYGSTSVSPIPLKIQAQWSQGTVGSDPSPSVDILDYVVGSASNAYNSTPAVIDTTNRTITWTISSFPGNTTGKTVTFSLKTNSSYTGGSLVSFTISARATSGSTTTPDQTVTQNYLYVSTSTSTSTSSSSTPTPTSTVTPTPASLAFSDISINSISQSQARISVTTNNNAALNLLYGTSIGSLSQNVKTLFPQKNNLITITDLEPDANYYFRITATGENGNTIKSDVFTFKTAVISTAPTVSLQSLIVTSNNNVLLNPQTQITRGQTTPKYIVVTPSSSVFEFQFALDKQTQIKSVQVIIKNSPRGEAGKNVLGASTFSQPETGSNFVDLVEVRPGVYTGRLLSPKDPGNYELYAKIIDFSGNITIQKITDIRVVNRFKVLEKGTKKPVENARVLFYLYNPTTKIFEVISPQILSINNPLFSNLYGLVDVVLPRGKYRADISAIGFNSAMASFEIDFAQGDYPTVYLEAQPFNIFNTLKYYGNTFLDSLKGTASYIRAIADSNRLFDLITTGTLFAFVITTLFAFSAKTHISFFYLPYFLIYKINILLKKDKSSVFLGKVVEDTTQNPISRALVSLIDSGNNTIAALKTNKLGEFYYPNLNLGDYKIAVIKDGFEQTSPLFYKKEDKTTPLVIPLKKDESKLERKIDTLLIYAIDFVGLLFEFMLTLGIILEIFFIFTFGFLKIAPFLLISSLNIFLLFLFLYNTVRQEAQIEITSKLEKNP